MTGSYEGAKSWQITMTRWISGTTISSSEFGAFLEMHSTLLNYTQLPLFRARPCLTSHRAPNPEANKAGFCIRRKPHVAAGEGIDMDLHHLKSPMIRLKFLVKIHQNLLTFWNSQGLLFGIHMVWKGYAGPWSVTATWATHSSIHYWVKCGPKTWTSRPIIHICQDKWGKWFWTHATWQRTDRHNCVNDKLLLSCLRNLEILGISCACTWSHTKQVYLEIRSKHV